jgi:outer membrane biosynthesis protein TonB
MDESRDVHEQGTWGARLRRRGSRPPRRFVAYSIALHALFVALMFVGGLQRTRLPEFETFRVTLISPPPTEAGEPEPVVTTTPVVTPPPPEPEPVTPPPEPQPPPPPTPPRTQAPTPTPPERRPDPPPARGPDPVPATVGGENLRIEQDGRDFQYPEYLENIMRVLTRYFRPPAGQENLEAEVVFYINRDGSAGGIRVQTTSGSFQFNAQAMQAVEQAGRARAFGPLPADWQRDRLYISYTFERPR